MGSMSKGSTILLPLFHLSPFFFPRGFVLGLRNVSAAGTGSIFPIEYIFYFFPFNCSTIKIVLILWFKLPPFAISIAKESVVVAE